MKLAAPRAYPAHATALRRERAASVRGRRCRARVAPSSDRVSPGCRHRSLTWRLAVTACSCGSTCKRWASRCGHAARTACRCGGPSWRASFPTQPSGSWTVSPEWGGAALREWPRRAWQRAGRAGASAAMRPGGLPPRSARPPCPRRQLQGDSHWAGRGDTPLLRPGWQEAGVHRVQRAGELAWVAVWAGMRRLGFGSRVS